MRHHFTLINSLLILLLIIQDFVPADHLSAQQTTMHDYVLFSGDGSGKRPPVSSGNGVQLGASALIQGGSIGSYNLVRSTGSAIIDANIFSGGAIHLANNNAVTGRITAAKQPPARGTILSIGAGADITGDIDVNGNILVGGGRVNGRVEHPAGTFYSGPVPANGNVTGQPKLPVLPQLPAITHFVASAHLPDINSTRSIGPGVYDDIKLSGGKTITFNGPGEYVFDKIDNNGINYFVFDFKNNASGSFRIYVHNDADLGKISASMINGGSATKIFTEVHGNGSSCRNGKWGFSIDNGYSEQSCTSWLGTVWVPYAAINIGSGAGNARVAGALWSGAQVNIQCGAKITYAPYCECSAPGANAGPDGEVNFLKTTRLAGSSTTPGATFSWQAINGGTIVSGAATATPEISTAGTYILTVSSGANCYATDTAIITGKINNLIGSELDALYNTHDTSSALSKTIFQFNGDNVLIDVIAKQGSYNQLKALLLTAPYGLFDTVSNGPNSLIITGEYPIKNLRKLDSLVNLINHARPVYPPLGNTGLIESMGDSAIRTNYVRNGFGVQGDGIRVGVLSDSYDKIPGDPAARDVLNGDLPGIGNPVNSNPVHVLKDYPYGRASDEGRAMLQIVHDVAPKAKLSFRTGFVTAGDFAEGIKELASDSCNVIVDDITYITEPFFKTGVIGKAINDVTAAGVHYVTAAGNFGVQSYESVFNPANTPNGLPGRAHNFGGGDILQSDSVKGTVLTPGLYTVVLQWVDDIYSLGGSATGTQNDLDIYLADQNGTALFGVNTNNIGKDPIEVLPFTITSNTTINVMVVNASAAAGSTSSSVRFKYVVFRGDLKINEHQLGSSTIVGQGNADAAITVGAALYSNTPAFGVTSPTIASFSSTGGTPVDNVVHNKPDIVGPNGVNTSVNFGNIDYENDGLPNFFGTSAAAPHVAGAVALILEARKKFYNQAMSPADVKNLLHATSIDMGTPGFDFTTGYGFLQADSALRTFANPKPFISKLQLADSSLLPGVQPMELIVHGNYLSSGSKIIFGTDTLSTNVVSNTEATATLPVFSDNKFVTVYTAPETPSLLDGGLSNSISITGLAKKNITIIADNKTKKYGEKMPVFTSTILVDGDSLQHTTLTVTALGLNNISYQTRATPDSGVGIYSIQPSRSFDSTGNKIDSALLSKYNYAFTDGALTVVKLPVRIVPRDTTLVYGQKIGNFNFNYTIDSSIIADNPAALFNNIKSGHESQLANNAVGLINGRAVTIVNGRAVPIVNGDEVMIVDGRAVTIVNGRAVPIVNSQSINVVQGRAVTIVNNLTPAQVNNLSFLATTPSIRNARKIAGKTLVNGIYVTDTTNIVDITQESLLDFDVNSAQTTLSSSVSFANARGLADVESLTSGRAVTIVNGRAVTIVNGRAVTIVNGQEVTIVDGRAVTIVNGRAVPIVNGQGRNAVVIDEQDIGLGLNPLKSINMITGLTAGVQSIIPGTLLDDNLDISYGQGKLTILPAPITIKAKDTSKLYGQALVLDSTGFYLSQGVLMYLDSIIHVTVSSDGAAAAASGGTHPIVVSNAAGSAETDLSNYNISYQSGVLDVLKVPVHIKVNDTCRIYGDPNPGFTVTYTGFVNGQTFATSGITGSPSFITAATISSCVGTYPVNAMQGSLSSANYSFTFSGGILTINKACLDVKADDKIIDEGDPLPVFTSVINRFKAGDYTGVSYSLSPACAGAAGVYTITPMLKAFANSKNYRISYTSGKLYINPKGPGVKNLVTYLGCVEETNPGSYIAHFYCVNDNNTPVYVSPGADNALISSGTANTAGQPFIFMPGTTWWNVPFDGKALHWDIKTYNCYVKTLASAAASASSPKCSSNSAARSANTGAPVAVNDQPKNGIAAITGDMLNVYPNPVRSKAVLSVANEAISEKGLSLFDNNGRLHAVKMAKQIAGNAVEIDLSGLASGMYFMHVKVKNGYKTICILKE